MEAAVYSLLLLSTLLVLFLAVFFREPPRILGQ
uniref:Photosystem II protein T n=2 Tax=Colpodellida TaxID=877183 RepID=D9IXS5_9ALVE|nr:photosystem II protein T [Chromerida sp. RM11]YP_003795469.1 photosystem II protein T [Chromerida sp. RM11]ADJ66642.1 photosystem II protein T [Chromerida sp. RM11]ADJ66657.1 photosystem II protein T [Chromerida sp. RM11]AGI04053.1 photosystem II protein T [Vitrella brassicaformis]